MTAKIFTIYRKSEAIYSLKIVQYLYFFFFKNERVHISFSISTQKSERHNVYEYFTERQAVGGNKKQDVWEGMVSDEIKRNQDLAGVLR